MKKMIAEEIERIKKLEEEQKAKQIAKEKQEQESKAKEQEAQIPKDPQISFQSKCLIETIRLEKEKEEMRIRSEEARKAAERREQAR